MFCCFLSLCSACRFVCALIVRDRLHASKKNAARAESPGRACPVIAQSEKFSDERRPTHVVALESVENTSLSLSCARVSHSFAVRVRDWLCFLARFISPSQTNRQVQLDTSLCVCCCGLTKQKGMCMRAHCMRDDEE